MLLDESHDSADVVSGKALQRHPVERGLARIGRQEAHEHVCQRRLAAPLGPTRATGRPGQLQVNPTKRGAPAPG